MPVIPIGFSMKCSIDGASTVWIFGGYKTFHGHILAARSVIQSAVGTGIELGSILTLYRVEWRAT